jgi:hypothetical protein
MKRARISERLDKLARIERMTRKDVDKGLGGARESFSKAKQKFDAACSEFDAVQKRVDELKSQVDDAKSALIELSDIARTMDLTGAQESRDRKGTRTYMIGGKESEVDCSDARDPKVTEYTKPKKGEDPMARTSPKEPSADDGASDDSSERGEVKGESFTGDVSLADDPDLAFASDILSRAAKELRGTRRFR